MTTDAAHGWAPLSGLSLVLAATGATALCLAVSAQADTAPRNLVVNDTVRIDLLNAGAALKGLPVSDFAGLARGQTYYAFDPRGDTYWAGARLVPNPNAYQAQVADQDAGSYLLFRQPLKGTWSAVDDGVVRGPGCPAPLPASIVALWAWDPRQCRPKPES